MRSLKNVVLLFSFIVAAFISSGCAMKDAPPSAESEPRPPQQTEPASSPMTIIGRITDEGAECMAMRSDDGKLFTIGRPKEELKPGDRIRVTGTIAEMSFCMQGVTLNVTRIERLPAQP